jgi:hypothetical protein
VSLCAVRVKGRLCGNPAKYRVTTLAETFLTCSEHVSTWRVRPTARIEVLP